MYEGRFPGVEILGMSSVLVGNRRMMFSMETLSIVFVLSVALWLVRM